MNSMHQGFGLILVGICLLMTNGGAARAGTHTEGVLSTELKGQEFKAHLKEGYHFNETAPNGLSIDGKSLKPSMLKGREAEFKDLPPSWSNGRASLYICDDALTFCEPNYVELKGTGAPAKVVAPPKGTTTGRINKHGFIENDYAQAVDKVQKAKGGPKLLLIDFSARWCPGCVRLETEVFETRKFKSLTKDFVKLKIDVDTFESRVPVEKFGVQGIPALVIVNSEQEEISRIVDYQPIETLENFFKSVREDSTPLKALASKDNTKDSKAALRLGQRLLSSGRVEESLAYLTSVQPPPPELLDAKVRLAESRFHKDPAAKPGYLQTLREAVQAEPSSSRSISWRESWVELIEDKAEKEKIRLEGVKLADSLLANPALLKEAVKSEPVGEFTGFEPMLVAMYAASLVETSGAEKAQVEESWKKAAEAGKKLGITAQNAGPAMRYLIILTSAKMYKEADELAVALLKKEPGNAEIQRRRLKILMGLNQFKEAIELGLSCIKNSYGRNEFWVAETMAKAYIRAERKAEAKSLIEQYLAREEINWPFLKDSKKSLEDLRKTI